MNQTIDVTHTNPKKRRWRLPGSVLLVLALTAGACSSSDSASGSATTTNDSTTTTAITTTTTTTEPSVEPVSETAPNSNDLEAYFEELEASGFGGVVAVRNGDDITTRAFGEADRENDIPMEAETVFDIASITKQFTAAAILRLEMEGRLSVDDTLGQHVPGLQDDQAAVTLHQLLTHTAGFPRDVGFDEEPIGRSDYLDRVDTTPLLHEPGDRYVYSNVGYALLGAVIEFETGEPYENYLRTALFEPAGMLDTGYVLPDWDGNTIAVGYDNASGDRFGRPNEQPWDVDGPYWNLRANGGILSTVADMLLWDEALLGDDVLDAAAKAKLFAPHVPIGPEGDVHYSYGWLIVPTPMGTPLITHNGGNLFFFADFLRFVEQDLTVFVASNSYQNDDNDLASEVAGRILGIDLSDDDGGDGEYDAELRRCGFDDINSLPEAAEIETLPDTPAGRTAAIFLDLLAEGDAGARLDFATKHVSPQLGVTDPTVVADGIEELQQQFVGYEVAVALMQDDLRFHLLLVGPSEVLLSIGFDETEPELVACFVASA
ncbi:MAG: serine hydrolase domain-containing protein [Acidimicrobiales bacterium]